MKSNQQFRSTKIILKSVIKDPDKIHDIQFIVEKVHRLFIHVSLFSKLYYTFLFDLHTNSGLSLESLNLPILDRSFLNCVINAIKSNKKSNFSSKSKELSENMLHFYKQHYSPLLPDEIENLDLSHLKPILDYSNVTLITNHETNIKMRFFSHLNTYSKSICNFKEYCISVKNLTRKERSILIKENTRKLLFSRIIF